MRRLRVQILHPALGDIVMTRVVTHHARYLRAFSEVLYEQRLLRNWSQDATAFSVGVSYGTYRAWENGRNFPSMNNLLTLCDVWGMRLVDLLTATERRLGWAPRPRKKKGKRLPTEEQSNVKHTRQVLT